MPPFYIAYINACLNILLEDKTLLFILGFRRKLSRIFDMCAEARKCKPECTHKFKEVRDVFVNHR